MNNLIVEAPLNSLSFGNVAFNILREFHKMDLNIGLFPIGNNADLSAFTVSSSFEKWIKNSIDNRWRILASKCPSLKLWHLNGGENRKSPIQNLLTFYECSRPTDIEVAVAKSQNKVLISSNVAAKHFNDAGCDNFQFVPMGFDEDFFKTGKSYLSGVIHFGLMGKFEKRKNTAGIIKAWLKKYGNNNDYQLTCCINNPFFSAEQMSEIIKNLFDGKRYTNINFLPRLKTNNEVNEFLNAIDIDLGGLSFAEGWNLPSFNATCMGKWSIVANHTAHKDWANEDNCILLECDRYVDSADGVFFQHGHDYNQGEFRGYSDEAMVAAFEKAELKIASQKENINGLKLAEQFSYKNTAQKILESFA